MLLEEEGSDAKFKSSCVCVPEEMEDSIVAFSNGEEEEGFSRISSLDDDEANSLVCGNDELRRRVYTGAKASIGDITVRNQVISSVDGRFIVQIDSSSNRWSVVHKIML